MGNVIELPSATGRSRPRATRPHTRPPPGPWGLGSGAAAAAFSSVLLSLDPKLATWKRLLAPLAFGAVVGVGTWFVLAQD